MRILWGRGRSSVDDVRSALPTRERGAYTTVQTVMNRLAERGLLKRERAGKTLLYTPRVSEPEYLSSNLKSTLAGASDEARRVAVARLVGDLDPAEAEEVKRLAAEVQARRAGD